MNWIKRSRLFLLLLLVMVVCLAFAADGIAGRDGKQAKHVAVADISFLDMVTYPTGYEFAGTEVGGLSGITYDRARDVYYILSDDRSEIAPSRYYTVDIDVNQGQLDVDFLDVTFLRDKQGDLFEPFAIDPESIELVRPGQLFISTEGDGDTLPEATDPAIMRFNPNGRQTGALGVPDKFLYSVDDGNHVRDNLAFESMTVAPNGHTLYVATENALVNDGPISTLDNGSPSRVLQYELPRRFPVKEFVYCVDPIPQAPIPPDAFADHGLVAMEALDDRGTLLTMERSFAVGVGNTILLFEASTQGATNVEDITALNLDGCPTGDIQPVSKELLVDLEADLGIDPDNVEGMSFGPWLSANQRLLILVSDNNFNDSQTTQIIALAVELVYE
ncbi:MAG TPA: esterase-like activity of phytase family protein [Candidatus Binatia bacterium]|jgi:3-phytase/alkaline phosphatase D|nr:esterase-like activity of phytase family protein [Candidatus Binatia bacterium]